MREAPITILYGTLDQICGDSSEIKEKEEGNLQRIGNVSKKKTQTFIKPMISEARIEEEEDKTHIHKLNTWEKKNRTKRVD